MSSPTNNIRKKIKEKTGWVEHPHVNQEELQFSVEETYKNIFRVSLSTWFSLIRICKALSYLLSCNLNSYLVVRVLRAC